MAETPQEFSVEERRMMLGIRAAGLLLIGLGVPVIGVVIRTVMQAGWPSGVDGADRSWSTGTLFSTMLNKSVIVTFMSSTGLYLAAIAAGLYLLRSNPRPLIRRKGEAT